MNSLILLGFIVAALIFAPLFRLEAAKDAYNVTYTTLGKNARESMPLGNGDISLNTWTYENGDIGLLIGKIDALSGKSNAEADACYSLRKIGRVRISLYPPIFKEVAENGKFNQSAHSEQISRPKYCIPENGFTIG